MATCRCGSSASFVPFQFELAQAVCCTADFTPDESSMRAIEDTRHGVVQDELTSKDYYFDSYSHFGALSLVDASMAVHCHYTPLRAAIPVAQVISNVCVSLQTST